MFRHHGRTAPARPLRPHHPDPLPADWLVLTDADRAMSALDAALTRTSRWQGNCS